jgi:hypothetical protein
MNIASHTHLTDSTNYMGTWNPQPVSQSWVKLGESIESFPSSLTDALTSMCGLSLNQSTQLNYSENKEGVEKVNYSKIINLYETKSRELIKSKNEIKKQDIIDKDEVVIDMKATEKICNEALNDLFVKHEELSKSVVKIASSYELFISKETKEKINKLNESLNTELKELNDKLEELKAKLELYEKPEDITHELYAYGILNKQGRLNIE